MRIAQKIARQDKQIAKFRRNYVCVISNQILKEGNFQKRYLKSFTFSQF